MVPVKHGEIRLTVNYQKPNASTIFPKTSIPRADKALDTLGGGHVFSVFD